MLQEQQQQQPQNSILAYCSQIEKAICDRDQLEEENWSVFDQRFEREQLNVWANIYSAEEEHQVLELEIQEIELEIRKCEEKIRECEARKDQEIEILDRVKDELRKVSYDAEIGFVAKELKRLDDAVDNDYLIEWFGGKEFPVRLVRHVFEFLGLGDANRVSRTCKRFEEMFNRAKLWKTQLKMFELVNRDQEILQLQKLDEKEEIHPHYLFGWKIEEDSSCTMSAELIKLPKELGDCANYVLKDRKKLPQPAPADSNENSLRTSSNLESKTATTAESALKSLTSAFDSLPSSIGSSLSSVFSLPSKLAVPQKKTATPSEILLEICKSNPQKYERELRFCEMALADHRLIYIRGKKLEKLKKNLRDLEQSKPSLIKELAILQSDSKLASKNLETVEMQLASDKATYSFLTEQNQTLSFEMKKFSRELETLRAFNIQFSSDSSFKLSNLESKRDKLSYQHSQEISLEKSQLINLAKQVKSMQTELEKLDKQERTYSDTFNFIKSLLKQHQ
jgi:chromosome segregation ATPase